MAQESKTPAPFRTSIGGQALIEGILMRGVDRQEIGRASCRERV